MLPLAAIVGGDGECDALPFLVRRIARVIDPSLVPIIRPILRVPESRLIKEGELERTVDLAARKIGGKGAILIPLDCDDGCPALKGPALVKRACAARPDILIAVVLAKREYEAWFLAAAESLRGQRGLSDDLTAPPDPESIRGAKEWLTDNMPPDQSYSETADQAALSELFDIQAARRADSFDKCYREIVHLLNKLRS